MFDYIIQPLILQETAAPQGMFGQPLYPLDAGIGTKTLYGTRAFAETFVPGIASYAGLVTPESVAEYVPSYPWRRFAFGKEGKSPLGIKGKESTLSRTFRSGLSSIGLPVQSPIDFNYIKNKYKQ